MFFDLITTLATTMPAPAIIYAVASAPSQSPQAPPQSPQSPPLLARLPCHYPLMFDPNGDLGLSDDDEDELSLANLMRVLDFPGDEIAPVQVLPPWHPSDMNDQ